MSNRRCGPYPIADANPNATPATDVDHVLLEGGWFYVFKSGVLVNVGPDHSLVRIHAAKTARTLGLRCIDSEPELPVYRR